MRLILSWTRFSHLDKKTTFWNAVLFLCALLGWSWGEGMPWWHFQCCARSNTNMTGKWGKSHISCSVVQTKEVCWYCGFCGFLFFFKLVEYKFGQGMYSWKVLKDLYLFLWHGDEKDQFSVLPVTNLSKGWRWALQLLPFTHHEAVVLLWCADTLRVCHNLSLAPHFASKRWNKNVNVSFAYAAECFRKHSGLREVLSLRQQRYWRTKSIIWVTEKEEKLIWKTSVLFVQYGVLNYIEL